MAQARGIQNLHVKGDVELIVCQVKDQYQARNDRLRHYRDLAWGYIKLFDAFNISTFPRELNDRADALVVSTTLLLPHQDFEDNIYVIFI